MTMEKFDRAGFMREIDWLLPQDRVGNYYADAAGSGDGDGDGRKPVDDRLKR